jgi:FkbM family methyltransferase
MRRLKYFLAARLKQHPVLMARIWRLMPRLGFLLPHDRSYYGLKRVVRPDATLVDVGANNGISARGFRKVMGPKAKIISFEANPVHQGCLERVAAFDSNFRYRIVGLGRAKSSFTLWTPYSGRTPVTALASGDLDYCRRAAARDYGESVAAKMRYEPAEVKVVPMDGLELQPDLIKVDVEGLDFDVLRGGEETLARSRAALLLEYTPGVSGPMLDWLADRDYRFQVYRPEDDTVADFDQQACDRAWESDPLQVNIYATPAERSGRAIGSIIQGWFLYVSEMFVELSTPWAGFVAIV